MRAFPAILHADPREAASDTVTGRDTLNLFANGVPASTASQLPFFSCRLHRARIGRSDTNARRSNAGGVHSYERSAGGFQAAVVDRRLPSSILAPIIYAVKAGERAVGSGIGMAGPIFVAGGALASGWRRLLRG